MHNVLRGENELKVFILCLLWDIGHPAPYSGIVDTALESGYLGYFDFNDIFAKLIAEGNITVYGDATRKTEISENIYALTERGRVIAENLRTLLPESIRTKGIAKAVRLQNLKTAGAKPSCTVTEENSGYRFSCSLTEKNKEIFSVSVYVKDENMAKKMESVFGERPDAVYRGILGMLTGDADFIF